MKITAILAAAQGFRPGKGHFFQAAVGHVVGITEDMAQLWAVVLNAGGVPEAFCDGHVEGISGVILCAFMQVGGAHDFPEDAAVQEVESGDPLHSGHRGMHACPDSSIRNDLICS